MISAPEETMARVQAAQAGDAAAMALLAKENLGLVRAAMRRFSGVDMQELYQAGCLGLVEAIRRFDVTRGVAFSTYAVPYILGEMRRFVREDRSVHVSRGLQATARSAHRAAESLRSAMGREPTLVEIAQEIAVAPDELAMALSSQAAPLSLDAPMGEDGDTSLREIIGDERQEIAFERTLVRGMLERCRERERALLQLRYFRGLSQEDTARALGLSQSQVSRLEKQILARLREEATG